jgi:hypothetical protein
MPGYFYEHTLREHFRKLAAQDRHLTQCGWYRRTVTAPPPRGWRSRAGECCIRLGHWLQDMDAAPSGQISKY